MDATGSEDRLDEGALDDICAGWPHVRCLLAMTQSSIFELDSTR
jgi:hypothetical protein